MEILTLGEVEINFAASVVAVWRHQVFSIGHWKVNAVQRTCGALKILCTACLPRWLSGRESTCKRRRHRFDPWSGKIPEEGSDSPLQYSCLGNPMDRGAWWTTVHGTAKSPTQLSIRWTDGLYGLVQTLAGWRPRKRLMFQSESEGWKDQRPSSVD